ncbi:DEAD/DEAH box helicase [Glacieibacterium megasporae]|uniref:DEAD/DEAH box helicase n=1 Tax=Glacieibacterium megasporae TaxID=2835787 RepID=UPI001C1E8453|nr:DEAD/DEAH box helicase [Polymorphobacter megasporae]UAJ09744.1 DEAD/DEAH box helicase [Polymorphobacter megasporae]
MQAAGDEGDAAANIGEAVEHRSTPASIGLVATRLAEVLAKGNVIYVATDEQRAAAVANALAQAAPEALILHVPSSDALPGDDAPASPANIGRRVAALYKARAAHSEQRVALIASAEAATRLYPPVAAFDAALPVLRVGEVCDLETVGTVLGDLGYVIDDRVDEPGEFAVRGQVVDLFPADSDLPVRAEVADGRITALRVYDPATQLSSNELASVEIGRSADPSLGDCPVTLFDHLPGADVGLDPNVASRRDRFVALVADAARARPGQRVEPVADKSRWSTALAGRCKIELNDGEAADAPRFVEGKSPLRSLVRAIRAALAADVRVIIAGAARDNRFIARQLHKAKIETVAAASWAAAIDLNGVAVAMLEMPVDRGWKAPGLLVIAAADVLGSRALTADALTGGGSPLLAEISELRLGDVVIHEDFGIGVIFGLEALPGDDGDAFVLEYAAGARRLVPVADADRIWRYGADADAVTLDRLDGAGWQKRRGEIDAAIAESARGLTALASARADRKCPAIVPDVAAYERFVAGFQFTETPDQLRAIAAVRDDLADGSPMDRLVVGDVGYGKTEVALRAAAMVALAGRQVVIAAPTTVLVRQHLDTFRKRFARTDVVVAGLSRLSSAAEKKAVKAGLADGTVHIVVGTGAVAGKGVAYADLALIVVDEEQRFGAADKAKLRALSENAHILTLTATPIPRTLQTALVGLQQLSVIATPPARRQPIRTSVGEFDAVTVRTALLREKSRGGQSFVVVPRIEDMAAMAARLAKIAPELSTREAHGKMAAADIDEAMVRFGAGDGDVLLATNIIEAGLDVPRANTMIVWRADRFGLSQLHQLRGRVGRGGRRGQVLLVTEPGATIAAATLKRLRTLQAFDRLGAGFAISARDLDMRGAGDLLGDTQAGHLKLIGVDLYQHLLSLALRAARGEAVDHWVPDLRLGFAGRLPEHWIPDVEARLSLYGRLVRLLDPDAIDAFEAELEDRFGPIASDAAVLLDIARVRAMARALAIAKVEAGPAAIAMTLRPHSRVDAAAAGLVGKKGRYLLTEALDDGARRVERTRELLAQMET